MSNAYNDIELIDNYLDGNLKGDALQSFKLRLENDLAFAEQVAAQNGVRESIVDLALKEELNQAHDRFVTKKLWYKSPWLYGSAVFVIGILALSFWGVFNSSQPKEISAAVENEKKSPSKETVKTKIETKTNTSTITPPTEIHTPSSASYVPTANVPIKKDGVTLHDAAPNEVIENSTDTVTPKLIAYENVFDKVLGNQKPSLIKIKPEKGGSFQLNSGMLIKIPPSVFEDNLGNDIFDYVELSINDYYLLNNWMKFGLSSAFKNQNMDVVALANITATHKDKKLKLKRNKSLEISFPTNPDHFKNDVALYSLDKNTTKWNFIAKSYVKDKIVNPTIVEKLDPNFEYSTRLPYPHYKKLHSKRAITYTPGDNSFDELFAGTKASKFNTEILKRLSQPTYHNTFVYTVPFMDRIAACIKWNPTGEWLQFYQENTHKSLYFCDSMVFQQIKTENFTGCNIFNTPKNSDVWKQLEFFSYQMSQNYDGIVIPGDSWAHDVKQLQIEAKQQGFKEYRRYFERLKDRIRKLKKVSVYEMNVMEDYYRKYKNQNQYINQAMKLETGNNNFEDVEKDFKKLMSPVIPFAQINSCERNYYNAHLDSIDRSVWKPEVFRKKQLHYTFKINQLGWVAAMKSLPSTKLESMVVKIHNYENLFNVQAYLLYGKYNTIVKASLDSTGNAKFIKPLAGEDAFLIVIGQDEDGYVYNQKRLLVGKTNIAVFELLSTDKKIIEKALNREMINRDVRGYSTMKKN